jgi:glycosyltransferase involved in cell wall biosynthesis
MTSTAPGQSILLVAYYFMPENTSGATRPGQFAKYLPGFGYEPYIISRSLAISDAGQRLWRVPDQATATGAVQLLSRIARWTQHWLLPYNEQLPWVPFAERAITAQLRAHGIGLVLSTSPPIAAHLAVLGAKLRNSGIKWIVDLQDPLWGNPFRNRRMASYYDRTLEQLIFRYANALIANTEPVGALWRERYPAWRHKIHVITNGFDPDDGMHSKAPVARNRRIVAHVGSIYGGRRPDAFLFAVLRLMERGSLNADQLRIRFVGPIEQRCAQPGSPPFSTLVEKGCLEYSGVTVPLSEAQEAMMDADYLLLLDVNENGVALQVPAKLYDYVRAGRPILALTPSNSPSQAILEKSAVWHRCVPAEAPPREIESCIEQFFSNAPPETKANAWFLNTFSARTKTNQLFDILNDLENDRVAK